MFLLSPRNVCVSINTNFVLRYKVFEMAKLRDIAESAILSLVEPNLYAFTLIWATPENWAESVADLASSCSENRA